MPMASVARAIERDETAGLMKIVVDHPTLSEGFHGLMNAVAEG